MPAGFVLEQNVPNPFNPETTIRYRLPSTQHVRLEVFNVLGNRIATFVDEKMSAGEHHVRWDGKDASGKPVASGFCFYRIYFGGKSIATRRMMLLQ